MRKALRLAIAATLVFLAASQWPDIRRYLRIKQVSTGAGHPGNIPAGGTTAYPREGHGQPEGTGDFDSASRGGPKA